MEGFLYLQTGQSSFVHHNAIEETDHTGAPITYSLKIRWNLSIVGNRLKTFTKGWKLDFLAIEDMAKAGFYYTGIQDTVKCLYCPKEFQYWKKGDIPLDVHKRESPNCPFFIEEDEKKMSREKEVMKFQDFLLAIGVTQFTRVLRRNKMFTYFDSRLTTFGKCKKYSQQDIYNFCKAGYFLKGEGEANEKIICFCCNKTLSSWKTGFNPWLIHARQSANCSFIQLLMGKLYVKNAIALSNESFALLEMIPEIRFSNLYKALTSGISKDTKSDQGGSKKISSSKCLITHHFQLNSSEKDPLLVVPDSMLCKICLKEQLAVIFFPCGHIIACVSCAVTLKECAVCREKFNIIMRVYIELAKTESLSNNDLESKCSSSTDVQPVDPMLCKVCRKEEMCIAFAPCRHVACCYECATKIKTCLICSTQYYGLIQVYL